ncbi:hypothetical protein, partial [Belnapia moabensis]|uniref:hypothetical protein n=1 Tax=Belnapia moabensis TaxID=365533 RepID=UPI001B806941
PLTTLDANHPSAVKPSDDPSSSKRPMRLSKNPSFLDPARHHWHNPEPTKNAPTLMQDKPSAQRHKDQGLAAEWPSISNHNQQHPKAPPTGLKRATAPLQSI